MSKVIRVKRLNDRRVEMESRLLDAKMREKKAKEDINKIKSEIKEYNKERLSSQQILVVNLLRLYRGEAIKMKQSMKEEKKSEKDIEVAMTALKAKLKSDIAEAKKKAEAKKIKK